MTVQVVAFWQSLKVAFALAVTLGQLESLLVKVHLQVNAPEERLPLLFVPAIALLVRVRVLFADCAEVTVRLICPPT